MIVRQLLTLIFLVVSGALLAQVDTTQTKQFTGPPEVGAAFPGGFEALNEYVAKHTIYPQGFNRKKFKGLVFVEFEVDEKGNIPVETIRVLSAAEVRRTMPYSPEWKPNKMVDLPKAFGDEAKRVIREGPTWIPAKDKGVAVRDMFVVPVKF